MKSEKESCMILVGLLLLLPTLQGITSFLQDNSVATLDLKKHHSPISPSAVDFEEMDSDDYMGMHVHLVDQMDAVSFTWQSQSFRYTFSFGFCAYEHNDTTINITTHVFGTSDYDVWVGNDDVYLNYLINITLDEDSIQRAGGEGDKTPIMSTRNEILQFPVELWQVSHDVFPMNVNISLSYEIDSDVFSTFGDFTTSGSFKSLSAPKIGLDHTFFLVPLTLFSIALIFLMRRRHFNLA